MLLTFDFSSDTPLYIQLRNQIVVGIANGRLTPGRSCRRCARWLRRAA